jgi:predicted anti-sigma-YlaC factor YlaD
MNCRKAKALFSKLYDLDLNPETQEAVNKHIATCPECRSQYTDLEKAMIILKLLKEVELPPHSADNGNPSLEKKP